MRTDRDLFTTDDGGAHWQRLDKPVGGYVDLAISHGVVYLVAYDANANNFGLWSAPSNQLAWSKDALTLQVGAGPVPFQQLVFSGGSGWVILGLELENGALRTAWSGNHTQVLATSVPLLVMDMYEHAYQMDFGAAAAKYIDAFFVNIKWDEVNRRYERALAAAKVLRG